MRNCPKHMKSFKTKDAAADWIMSMELAEKSGKLKSAMKGRQFVLWNLVMTPALALTLDHGTL